MYDLRYYKLICLGFSCMYCSYNTFDLNEYLTINTVADISVYSSQEVIPAWLNIPHSSHDMFDFRGKLGFSS